MFFPRFLAVLALFVHHRDCKVVGAFGRNFLQRIGLQEAPVTPTSTKKSFSQYVFTDTYLVNLQKVEHPVFSSKTYKALVECIQDLERNPYSLGDFKRQEERGRMDFWKIRATVISPDVTGVFCDIVKPVSKFDFDIIPRHVSNIDVICIVV